MLKSIEIEKGKTKKFIMQGGAMMNFKNKVHRNEKRFNIYAFFLHIINKIVKYIGLMANSIQSDLVVDKLKGNKQVNLDFS